MDEQADQAQKSEGLMRMAACDCSVLIVAVWWGRGEKHGGLKVRPGISRFKWGRNFLNLGWG